MLKLITDAPLKVPAEWETDFSFFTFVLSAHRSSAEEVQHLSEQRGTRDPPRGMPCRTAGFSQHKLLIVYYLSWAVTYSSDGQKCCSGFP